MTLSANQPYFLPYFPYWQLIHAADCFLVADDYAYIRHGWINRNRLEAGGREFFFRIELEKASRNKLIKDIRLMPVNVADKLKKLESAYGKAPFFREGYALAQRILLCPEQNLSAFLTHSIREVCAFLGIETPLAFTSAIEGNALLKREQRIYDFCHRLHANHYINAIGGRNLYSCEAFRKQGIRLNFLHSRAQEAGTLSVLDAVMKHSRDQLHRMLDQYTLIDE